MDKWRHLQREWENLSSAFEKADSEWEQIIWVLSGDLVPLYAIWNKTSPDWTIFGQKIKFKVLYYPAKFGKVKNYLLLLSLY